MKRYSADYFYHEYLPTFKATSDSYNMDIIRGHYHQFLRLAAQHYASGRRLLDVGCGAGFFLKAAQEMGWDAEGVELSETAAGYAHNVLGLRVLRGKFEDGGFSDESFDIVTLQDTLEHLSFPRQALIEVRRVLKHGGLLLLNTPDFNSLSRRFLGPAWAVLSPAEHLTYYTERTLLLSLRRAGFHVLGIRNLLNFNPDYTHDKTQIRYKLWKGIQAKLRGKKIIEKIYWFEYKDLLIINRENASHELQGGPCSMLKKDVIKGAKRILRGDMLVAVARK